MVSRKSDIGTKSQLEVAVLPSFCTVCSFSQPLINWGKRANS